MSEQLKLRLYTEGNRQGICAGCGESRTKHEGETLACPDKTNKVSNLGDGR